MAQKQQLFMGVTISPIREWTARLAKESGRSRIWACCAGRFAAIEAMVRNGIPRDSIFASDITIFSSIIGYMADPDKSIYDLGIQLDDEHQKFVVDVEDELDFASGVLLAIRFAQIAGVEYQVDERQDIIRSLVDHRDRLKHQLGELLKNIEGIHYEASDFWLEFEKALDDDDGFLDVSPSWYKGGYTKMFSAAERIMNWNNPGYREMEPDSVTEIYERATGAPLHMSANVMPEHASLIPEEGWHKTAIFVPVGKGVPDYIVTNYNPGWIAVKMGGKIKDVPKPRMIYNGEPITEDSIVGFTQATGEEAMYYRDILSHRMASGDIAHPNLIMSIDGRVAGIIGFQLVNVDMGKTKNGTLLYGITVTKEGIALSRLMSLCASSSDMHKLLLTTNIGPNIRTMTGLISTEATNHDEVKVNRGIGTVTGEKTMPNGERALSYNLPFRDETFHDCLMRWLSEQARRNAEPQEKRPKRMRISNRPQEEGAVDENI